MHCILDVSNPQRGKAIWRLLLDLGRLVFRKMAGILWVLSCDLGHSGLCLGQLLTPTVKCNWAHAWSRDACLCCRFCSLPPAFVHTSLNLCTGLFISPLFSISFSFFFSFFLIYLFFMKLEQELLKLHLQQGNRGSLGLKISVWSSPFSHSIE